MTAIEKIEKQQAALKQGTASWYVGEQLKEICADPRCAELVSVDLDNPAMGLTEAEKKIAKYASAHRTGNCGCCPPKAADGIIREFYGLPAAGETPAKTSTISLDDYM